ncbi:sensor domain-containing diguanylate cyclase [Pleionea sp. CnH1-48]|uniref:sensor domain-containing diguanylate cyclase n=1 Tax=Pleionea sp. CnH1-48 TaxID=2954494 RepID=UPI002096EEAD|nr:diguanylate cyclase [Pleionea sp. CnH1-48]MCO7223886.1 diguanylate cyclase [Pleionea sp. CnH1-48]
MIEHNKYILDNSPPALNVGKWQKIVDLIAELYDAPCGAIVQYIGNEFKTVVTTRHDNAFMKEGGSFPWEMDSFCRHIIERSESLYVKDAPNHERWKNISPVSEGGVQSYLGMELRWPDGKPFGTICVLDKQSTEYKDAYIQLLEQFKELVQADLELIQQCERLKVMSLSDDMTGLFNRRGFFTLGEQKLKLAKRFGSPVGLLYLDLDKLKSINDLSGHHVGDKAIRELADVIQSNVRESDLAARLGGDEFVIMAISQDTGALEHLVERIHRSLDRASERLDIRLDLKVSIGCHLFEPEEANELEDMLRFVDRLMYEQKQQATEDSVKKG